MTDTLRGILAMLASMLAFNIGDTLVKLTGKSLPVGEMLFVRGIFATVLVLAAAQWMGVLGQWRRLLTWPVFWRVMMEITCSVLFFVALLRMNFADAAAIGQFTPLAVMAGAALFLGEPVGWRRWSAAAVGLLGVLLIIKPGTGAFQPIALVMLVSMLAVAIRDLITRRLPKDLPTVLLTASSAIAVLLVGPLMIPFEEWHYPTATEYLVLFVCAASVLIGYVFIIIAMRHGETGVVSPFRYAYMVFAVLSSVLIFRETPDWISWSGIGLIVGSGLYMVHRERAVRLAKMAQPLPAEQRAKFGS